MPFEGGAIVSSKTKPQRLLKALVCADAPRPDAPAMGKNNSGRKGNPSARAVAGNNNTTSSGTFRQFKDLTAQMGSDHFSKKKENILIGRRSRRTGRRKGRMAQ